MTTYMVERDLRGISIDALAAAQKAAIAKAAQMTAAGWIDEGVVMCAQP